MNTRHIVIAFTAFIASFACNRYRRAVRRRNSQEKWHLAQDR